MRKLLFSFLLLGMSIPLFAQTSPALPGIEVLLQEVLKLITPEVKNQKVEGIDVKESYFDEDYTTKEYLVLEWDGGRDEDMPISEERTTKGYNELTLTIPAGYRIVGGLHYDVSAGGLYYNFGQMSTMINEDGMIEFQLDYDVEFANPEYQTYFEQNVHRIDPNKVAEPIKVTIRYSPKYFTLKIQDKESYAKSENVEVTYKGKKISFDAITYAALVVTDKKDKIVYYTLEPNFQNIYNDFKFVRKECKLAAR